MTRIRVILILALSLSLAACGGDDGGDDGAGGAGTPTPTETPTPTPTGTPASGDEEDVSVKPTIAKPQGEPPAQLRTQDLVRGDGRTAREGDQVTVQYVGASYSTGEEFDASWDRGQPFPFTLGAGEVIPGWDEGVAGMKVGGRRRLVIPPEQGYGPEGTPDGAIAPNETLIFVVDLVDVQPGSN